MSPEMVAAIVGIVAGVGSMLVRWLDPKIRQEMHKDAIGEWRELAEAQRLKNAEIEARLTKTEQEAAANREAAAIAKREADAIKQEAERIKIEAAKHREEQDAAIARLNQQVEELTRTLTERTEAAGKRETELETELEGALTELILLRGYVNQLKDLMEGAGIEVPPMPAGVKPKRRRRKVIRKDNPTP